MKGQLNIVAIMGFIVIGIFLAALMPTLLGVQGDLVGSLAGHPVEMLLGGLIVFFIVVAFIMHILSYGQPTVPAYSPYG